MRVIASIVSLVLVLLPAGCARLRPEARAIKIAGDAEVRIVPGKVILTEDQPEPRTVTVTGDAEVRVVPDEVILTLGVETWSKDLAAAKKQNDERVQKVLALARDQGIEPRHLQTDHVSIEPRYRDNYEQKEFIGYFVRKTVVITLRDISRFEALLSSALEGGATHVHGVQFRTTELRKHRDAARALAIKAAQEKANALASELGQQVGQPLSIEEEYAGWWSWYNSWWGSRWGEGMAQNVVQNVGEAPFDPDSAVAPGQISVNARVTVVFELQ